MVIVLVSVESLNSDFIQTQELRTALDRLHAGLTRVVPVIVSPCVWKFDPILKKMQALPSAGPEGVRPVSEWSSNHLAWTNVAERIGDMVEDVFQKREAEENAARLKEAAKALTEKERRLQLHKKLQVDKDPAIPWGRYIGRLLVALLTLTIAWWIFKTINPPSVASDDNFVLIPGGTFTMGCTREQQDCEDDEKPTRKVTISAFRMAKTELTFDEYDAFCDATQREKPSD